MGRPLRSGEGRLKSEICCLKSSRFWIAGLWPPVSDLFRPSSLFLRSPAFIFEPCALNFFICRMPNFPILDSLPGFQRSDDIRYSGNVSLGQKRFNPVNDIHGGMGIDKIGGPDLHGRRACNEKFQGIFRLHDPADADDGNFDNLRYLPNHPNRHGSYGRPGQPSGNVGQPGTSGLNIHHHGREGVDQRKTISAGLLCRQSNFSDVGDIG